MPNTHRGIVRAVRKTFKKYANIDSKLSQCEDWFGGRTTYTVVSELDDPTWPCIECLPKVVSDFIKEQSRVHIMPISAKWKHKSSIHIGLSVFNGGVTTFFAKSVMIRTAQIHSISAFSNHIKHDTLESYSYDCIELICNMCNTIAS